MVKHRHHQKASRVVGYIRVSTEDQAREGVSLDAQRAKLEAYALAMDIELVAIHEDAGVSAKSLDRPGLSAALKALENGEADGILVTKLDRLTRSVRDLGSLLETHFGEGRCDLLSVADSVDTRTAGGRLVLNVLASVSQWEREAIGERTREALAHLKASGVKLGGPRLEDEETLSMARRLRDSGMTLREVARDLEAAGRPTLRGGRWGPQTVRLLLSR